jgi:ADP-heptose:LPS heptosyltransferase
LNPHLRSSITKGLRRFLHLVLTLARPKVESKSLKEFSPRKILVLNGAHIGDVIISTSIIGVLGRAYPGVEIGFVSGSWAQFVLTNHPEIKHLHTIDHWRSNRARTDIAQKVRRYWRTKAAALREIRAVDYDVAICLHPWFPDMLDVAWQANIPIRAAFSRSFLAPLATTLVAYPNLNEKLFRHQAEIQGDLLTGLGIPAEYLANRRTSLGPSDDSAMAEVRSLFADQALPMGPYYVLHIGSGSPVRELPITFWRELIVSMPPDNPIVLTGKGSREEENASKVAKGFSNCINACNRLSWNGFVAAVRQAEALIGIESMASHTAAAVGTKCVTIYSGTAGAPRWRPEGSLVTVWTNPVACSPCHRPNGCDEITCLKGISPYHVAASALEAKQAVSHLQVAKS